MSNKYLVKRVNFHCDKWNHTTHALEDPVRAIVIALRGGEPRFSYQVEYVDDKGVYSSQIHTITNTGIIYVGDVRSHTILTRYHCTQYKILDFYKINGNELCDAIDINQELDNKIRLEFGLDK